MERISEWAEERNAPMVATICMLIGVMAFSLLSHTVLHGGPVKLEYPSDLWSLSDSSTALLHGQFAHIYYAGSALTSPPGLEVVLMPVMLLGQILGLDPHVHGSGQPLSMWLVLAPAAVLVASSALFALDAVARDWHLPDHSRLALALVGGLGVANVVGFWGHPEDCVALAFVVWAARAMDRGGDAAARRAAWLLGLGMAFQPLAVLAVVPILCRLDRRTVPGLLWRLVLPASAVLVAPLLAERQRTLFVLVHQPFQPRYISFTPLTHLAPQIGAGVDGGGPSRLVALVLSSALALAVCRRRHDLATVLSVVAGAFFLRVLLETELNWYYLWPVPALCLLLALRVSWPRFAACAVALIWTMVLGNHRVHHIGWWWPGLIAGLVVMLLGATLPGRHGAMRAPTPGEDAVTSVART